MPFFAASEAPPRPESMKFPVFSLLAGNFGIFRDEFAADSPLQQRVACESDLWCSILRKRAGSSTGPYHGRGGTRRESTANLHPLIVSAALGARSTTHHDDLPETRRLKNRGHLARNRKFESIS